MAETIVYSGLALLIPLATVTGILVTHLRLQRRMTDLQTENTALKTTLDMERRATEEKRQTTDSARQQFAETFATLSSQALRTSTDEFLKLAKENLRQFHIEAQGNLDKKEQAIDGLLRPVKEALTRTERQLRELEKERKEAYGSLSKHLDTLVQTQHVLQGETRNLVQALRRPEVRGQWGEMTLHRLTELAGMVEHCDFYEQQTVPGEQGALRPDMVVRMPDGRDIVVDVKTPLDAYLSAVEATDDPIRQSHLERHARQVRERVKELSGRRYWAQFKQSPDFVVMFIPGDQFLAVALERDPDLLEYALSQKVVLATPTSFVALLRAVAYGWRQEGLAENAEKIRDLGEDLYQRLSTFTEHLERLGRNLSGCLEHYNRAVGSFERQVVPGARKFIDMGLTPRKTLVNLDPIEKGVRRIDAGGQATEVPFPKERGSGTVR